MMWVIESKIRREKKNEQTYSRSVMKYTAYMHSKAVGKWKQAEFDSYSSGDRLEFKTKRNWKFK